MSLAKKLKSVFEFKCPRCLHGDVFVHQNPYVFNGFFDMPKHCSSCKLKYEPEPGFFYGAMYVSYALSIIVSGFTWLVLTMLNVEFWWVITAIVAVLIIIIPLLFKISRVIWMNMFFSYDPKYDSSSEQFSESGSEGG